MLDIKYIRENKEKVKEACRNKKIDFDVDYLLDLDSRRRELLQLIEEKNAMKNQANQRIKEAETEGTCRSRTQTFRKRGGIYREKHHNQPRRQKMNPLFPLKGGKTPYASRVIAQFCHCEPPLRRRGNLVFSEPGLLKGTFCILLVSNIFTITKKL